MELEEIVEVVKSIKIDEVPIHHVDVRHHPIMDGSYSIFFAEGDLYCGKEVIQQIQFEMGLSTFDRFMLRLLRPWRKVRPENVVGLKY